jgi:hypothetical protein
MTRTATIGLFTGLILGLALIMGSFGDMLIVAFFGIVGVIVVKVLEGDIDLGDLGSRRSAGRGR